MQFTIISLFPTMFDALHAGIVGRAIDKQLIQLNFINILILFLIDLTISISITLYSIPLKVVKKVMEMSIFYIKIIKSIETI